MLRIAKYTMLHNLLASKIELPRVTGSLVMFLVRYLHVVSKKVPTLFNEGKAWFTLTT